MAYAAGVDVGSTQTKAVIIDEARRIVGRALDRYRRQRRRSPPKSAFHAALAAGGIEERRSTTSIGTGYGRYRVTFGNSQVTEISCHGRGAVHMFPARAPSSTWAARTRRRSASTPSGDILDFCMNDKCAAGTGRFLGPPSPRSTSRSTSSAAVALRGERPVRISTTCTVFAESEVLSWLGTGKKIEDILLGVHQSIAARSIGLHATRRHRARSDVHRRRGAQRRHGRSAERGAWVRRSTSARTRTSWARSARRCSRSITSLASRAPSIKQRWHHDATTAGIDVGSTYTKARRSSAMAPRSSAAQWPAPASGLPRLRAGVPAAPEAMRAFRPARSATWCRPGSDATR